MNMGKCVRDIVMKLRATGTSLLLAVLQREVHGGSIGARDTNELEVNSPRVRSNVL